MTNKQQNRLKMAETLQQFLSAQDAFSQNIPLQEQITDFNSILSQLQNHATNQMVDTTSHTEIKDANRESLIAHIAAYANAASVYFSDKNSALAKQLKVSKSKLLRLTGLELKAKCTQIYEMLNSNIDLINPQYVTAENISAILTKINLFDAKSFDANSAKDDTQNATRLIKEDLKKMGIVLGKIDQLMLQYNLTDRELYNRYRIARKISDMGKDHKVQGSSSLQ